MSTHLPSNDELPATGHPPPAVQPLDYPAPPLSTLDRPVEPVVNAARTVRIVARITLIVMTILGALLAVWAYSKVAEIYGVTGG